ncbi:MAG: DEAD/DEAH box helicase family protein [Candidatus Paceibacter sp.]|nr:DEAD/DEAH box helicase family protein [Candidatus Paceibacter sp.]
MNDKLSLCHRIAKKLFIYINNHNGEKKDRVLRDEQMAVFGEMAEFFNRGEHEGYIKLPTGVGKTVLFIEFLKATGLKSIIVVPTNVITDQTKNRIEEFADSLDYGIINAYEKDYGKTISITTYKSLILQVSSGKISPKDYECVILDEAHKALGKKVTEIIKLFPEAVKIGFTATPRYSDDKHLAHLLTNEITSMSVRSAIEGGLLSGCSVVFAMTEVNISQVSVQNGNYCEGELVKAINIESRNFGAVDIYKKMFSGKSSIVYCASIKHAEQVASLFQSNEIPARAISSKNNNKERESMLRDFSSGKIKVLCNADLLIHGFDEKKASVCINLCPTLSLVVAEQRAGRVLRLDNENPDKEAFVVDFLDVTRASAYQPISFAEILNGADVRGRTNSRDNRHNNQFVGGNGHDFSIGKIKVIANAEIIMRVINERRLLRKATNNWLNYAQFKDSITRAFAEMMGSNWSVEIMGGFIEKIKEAEPGWFSESKEGESLNYFCDPALVNSLKAEFKKITSVWINQIDLAERLKISEIALLEFARVINGNLEEGIIIDKIVNIDGREEKIHYIPRNILMKRVNGVRLVYFSPKMVNLLEIELRKSSGSGQSKHDDSSYLTEEELINFLLTSFGMSGDTEAQVKIKSFIRNFLKKDRIRVKNPFWFRNKVVIRESYSPEFIELIKGEVKNKVYNDENATGVHQKNILLYMCRERGISVPSFTFTITGPDNSPTHSCLCFLNDGGKVIKTTGTAKTKAESKKIAITEMCSLLRS